MESDDKISQIDDVASSGAEMLGRGLVPEVYACFGIDIQAPRFAPGGEGFRIEFSPYQDPAVTFCLFGGFFDPQKPIFVGRGHIEGVGKNGERPPVDGFVIIPHDPGNLFHDNTCESLRKEVKKLLIDRGLDKQRATPEPKKACEFLHTAGKYATHF